MFHGAFLRNPIEMISFGRVRPWSLRHRESSTGRSQSLPTTTFHPRRRYLKSVSAKASRY